MSAKLVIWGASSHAFVVADIIRLLGDFEIVGFLDNLNPERAGTEFCGATILGGADQLEVLLSAGIKHVIIGIGNSRARLQLAESARAKGYHLATAIHPRATVARDVAVGVGTVIAAGAMVNPRVRLGENVIINTGACVEHECTIADGAMINTGARLGGRVTVERAAAVEIGASVAAGTRIGAGSVVGAGSLVLHAIPDGVLAYGAPARVIRQIDSRD